MSVQVSGDQIICGGCKTLQAFSAEDLGKITVISAARTLGWRVWSGQTQSGEEQEIILCPLCSGNAPAAEAIDTALDWEAQCRTCGSSMAEEWGDDREAYGVAEQWGEEDAKEWEHDHECDKDTHRNPPRPKKI